jgi:hypothetical protein
MSILIFVEGTTDAKFLDRLLSDLKGTTEYKIVSANGANAVRPMARKALVTRHEPVVLVLDADSHNSSQVASQQRELSEYLAWGSGTTPFKVIQFVPEIEVLFFESPSVLNRHLGPKFKKEFEQVGKIAPKRMLTEVLSEKSTLSLIDSLNEVDLGELRRAPEIAGLRDFIQTVSNYEATAA